jgi:uncharacterized protein (TIRG00374 family)
MEARPVWHNWKRGLIGAAGIVLGAVFLWLATRHIDPHETEKALLEMDLKWLAAGVASYLAAIALRCLRWGILVRATGSVKWRHCAEALITGFAANYVLPGRVGELFRADYARRVFNMSRFTALGTIVVERVCDGIVLVVALWISVVWLLFTRSPSAAMSWILAVATASGILFGAALIVILISSRIELRSFGIVESIAARWDRLVVGLSSVSRGRTATVSLYSIGVWTLEAVALGSIVRCFAVILSPAEILMLLGLGSLSTLLPNAPGYVGTFQLLFGYVFKVLGYPETIGILAATAIQIFFFGTVTLLGGLLLLSRSGITLFRAQKFGPSG